MALECGSCFSGCGGMDLGIERAGVRVRWQCESDRACRDVLARRFSDCEVIYHDVSTLPTGDCVRVPVLIGGFPCTDVSISGRRVGLAGKHSGLFFAFARIIREVGPELVVIENVPGLLSSNARRDFALVLWTLRDLGAVDIGWRVLDAQWFGVAQRRNRVFLVADFGGRRAGEILALSEGLSGLPQPRRETWEAPPGVAASGPHEGCVSYALTTGGGPSGKERQQTVIAFASQSGGDVRPCASAHVSPALSASQIPAVAFPLMVAGAGGWGTSADNPNLIPTEYGVRRLTPREYERLQGLPDDWTRWGASGKEMADATRYRMCGNAVPVPVMEWIGRRIVTALDGGVA